MHGGDANGNEKFPDSETHAQQLMDKLGIQKNPPQPAGGPPGSKPQNPADKAKPGTPIAAKQNGRWTKKMVPYGDTGGRKKRKAAMYRKMGMVKTR